MAVEHLLIKCLFYVTSALCVPMF